MSIRLNRKSLVVQAAALVLSQMALQLLGFGYRILLGRMAGAEGMGVYTLVMQVYMLAMSFAITGVTVGVTTHCARHANDAGAVRGIVHLAQGVFAGLFLLFAVPVLCFRMRIAQDVLGDAGTAPALALVLVCIFLTGFENIWKAAFIGCKRVGFNIFSEITEMVVRIGAVAFLLVRLANGDHGWSAMLIILGMCLSEVVSVGFLCAAFHRTFRARARLCDVGGFIKTVLPAAGTAVACAIFTAGATLLFPARMAVAGWARSHAVSMLGVVSGMAGPLISLPVVFMNALCSVLLPRLSENYGAGNWKGVYREMDMSLRVTGYIACPLTAVLMGLLPAMMALLFQEKVDMQISALLALETAVEYYLIVSVNILNGLGRQNAILRNTIVSQSVELAGMWVLTGAYGLYGFLASRVIGPALRLSLNLWDMRRASGRGMQWMRHVLEPLLVATATYFCARTVYQICQNLDGRPAVGLLVALAVSGIVFFVILRVLGIRLFRYVWRAGVQQSVELGQRA